MNKAKLRELLTSTWKDGNSCYHDTKRSYEYDTDLENWLETVEDDINELCDETWLLFSENKELFGRQCNKNTLIKFDDGTVVKYGDTHPFAIMTHFKLTNN